MIKFITIILIFVVNLIICESRETTERKYLFAEKQLEIGESIYQIDRNFGQFLLTKDFCNVVETPKQLIHKVYQRILSEFTTTQIGWANELF